MEATSCNEGKNHKTTGSDGVSQFFFKLTRDFMRHGMLTIVNQVYTEGKMTEKQKHSKIVCSIPKKPHSLRN
jgi:hypothetical protein